MKKKRVTAGSVEELLEIVKAVQNGQEPDEALRKMRTESAPEADSPKSRSKETVRTRKSFPDIPEEPEEPEESMDWGIKWPDSGMEQGDKKAPIEAESDEEKTPIRDKEKSPKKTRTQKKKRYEEDDWEEEDMFDQILEEDDSKGLSFRPILEGIGSGIGKVSGLVKGLSHKISGADRSALPKKKEKKSDLPDIDEEISADPDSVSAAAEDLSESAEEPKKVEVPKTEEPLKSKRLPKFAMKERFRNRKKEETVVEEESEKFDSLDEFDETDDNVEMIPDPEDERKIARLLDVDTSEDFEDISDELPSKPGKGLRLRGKDSDFRSGLGSFMVKLKPKSRKTKNEEEAVPVSENTEIPETLTASETSELNKSDESDKTEMPVIPEAPVEPEKTVTPETPEVDPEPEPVPQEMSALTEAREKTEEPIDSAEPEDEIEDYLDDDEPVKKSVSKRTILLGAGVLVILAALAAGAYFIGQLVNENAKGKNVTADPGLTVKVEDEPEDWCNSYTVALKFRAKNGNIKRVTIFGDDYIPDERGMVTVTTTQSVFEVAATTDQGVLNATVEIPKLDSQPPIVYIDRDQNQIIVTAADSRSPENEIFYAEMTDKDYNKFPQYHPYTEPLKYKPNTMYYFFARDLAGNSSNPIITTTEPAESFTLSMEKVSLFPEGSKLLQVKASPEGALLNNVQFESADPSIVSVDYNGMVTAKNLGGTKIKVTVDGLPEVYCDAEVSETRTVTISAIGDCTLGSDPSFNESTNFDSYDAVNGHSYFFDNVRNILKNDDVTFANLEGPLTTATEQKEAIFTFKGNPEYTQILKDGSVEVVTLANNHAHDYLDVGLTDTERYLKEAGIDYCYEDEICMRDINGVQTAFLGFYLLIDEMDCEPHVRSVIQKAKNQGAELIITAFHWGGEKETQPDELQQYFAHLAIDCGSDLVVGHHSHVLQPIEKYKGRYIVYSLANFVFGGSSTPSDLDTMIYRQTFTVDCGEVEETDQVEIIPCSSTSALGYNNYQPTPAEGSEADRIMDKLNQLCVPNNLIFQASSGLNPGDVISGNPMNTSGTAENEADESVIQGNVVTY